MNINFFTVYSFVETVEDIQVTLEQKVDHGRNKKVCLLVKWPSRFLILLLQASFFHRQHARAHSVDPQERLFAFPSRPYRS